MAQHIRINPPHQQPLQTMDNKSHGQIIPQPGHALNHRFQSIPR